MARQRFSFIYFVFLVPFLGACSPKKTTQQTSCVVPEKTYCSTAQTHSGSTTTFTGTAVYKRRSYITACASQSTCGLNSVDTTNYPIRYAEVVVTNSAGTVFQCGETDVNGDFSLIVPQGGNYNISVNSRANNTNYKASVLNDYCENNYYSLKTTVAATSGTVSAGTLTAAATGSLEGGAFNILDQILNANIFLRTIAGNCSAFSGCSNFTVAPKVQAYWKPGFNPATLYGSSSLLSFYIPGKSQLFILGGSKTTVDTTDVNFSDTDHFDNTVILHEYGHFIEDIYTKTDSPAGSHDANSIIDPRLAWGEGWANFFGIAASGGDPGTGAPIYRDTVGNADGVTSAFFYHNLDTNSPSRDVPTQTGEGNFREFAVTRALWDALDPHPITSVDADSDGVQTAFAAFWHILTGPFKSGTDSYFRDYGLFMSLYTSVIGTGGATNLSSIYTQSTIRQIASRDDYAKNLTSTQKACSVSIQALTGYGEDGSYTYSNQFNSNDFYYYYHSGGTLTVNMTYSSGSDDLDLFIYKEGYTFGSSSGIVASSAQDPPTGESISASLPAGAYLINVNYYTGSSSPLPWTAQTYNLTIGSTTCP